MYQYHPTKNALIASILIWALLALIYIVELIPLEKSSLIISLLWLSLGGIFFAWQAGKRQWVLTYAFIGLIWCTIEGIWIATCRPYGCFNYSDLLWPKFFNTFPFLLFGVWPFLVISIAHLIPKKFSWHNFITIGIVLLLLLDLALDPVHIYQWIWSYEQGWYNRFGVPLQNFIWRILTWWLSMRVVEKRKNTITHPAWYYSGITLYVLFWLQFLFVAYKYF
jgi:uncharacterized membrane protein